MRNNLFSIAMLLLSIVGSGQQSLDGSNNSVTDLPNVVPPSPTVANLMKFEEVPVEMYTGQPSISIPLFSKGLDGGLGFSASLSYNTSGVRIDERSGWTGTGWSLFAGGVISRTVMGIHDEAREVNVVGDGAPGDVGSFHSGYYDQVKFLYDFQSGVNDSRNVLGPGLLEYQEFLWNTTYGIQNFDYQSDLFQFNFMGYSGRFIIVNDNNTLVPKLLSSSQRVKIELDYDRSSYEINSFTVKTPNGYQFVFGNEAIETTITHGRKAGQSQSGSFISDDVSSFKESRYTSSWHLTAIKSPNNFTVCNFNYQDIVVNFSSPKSVQRAKAQVDQVTFSSNFGSSNANADYNASLVPPAIISTWNILQVNTKKLKDVVFRDGSKVAFKIKGGHPEQDNSTGCILEKIEVFEATSTIPNKEFIFNYKTSTKNRLFLTGVTEKAGTERQNYNLSYHSEDILPGYGSPEKDAWGYYKAPKLTSNTDLTLIGDVLVNGNINAGLLKEITYPTGGTKEFTFEPHEFSFLGDVLIDPKDIDENYESITAINNITLRGNPLNSGSNNSLFLQIPNDADVSIILGNTSGSSEGINNHYIEIIPANTSDITNLVSLDETTEKIFLKKGSYQVRLNSSSYFPNPNLGPAEVSTRITLRYSRYKGPNVKHKTGGGFRIKEIRFMEGNEQQTKVSYNYPLFDNTTMSRYGISGTSYSSGSFDGALGTRRKSVKRLKVNLRNKFALGQLGAPPCSGNAKDLSFLIERFGRSVEANMSKGNYVGYKNVETYQDNNGKSTMLYTNAIDFPAYDADFYEDISPIYNNTPDKDLDFKRGNLLENIAYDSTGRKVSKTTNQYDYEIISSERYFFKYSENESCSSAISLKGRTFSSFKTYFAFTSCEGCTNPANFIDVRPAYYEYGLPFMKESISKQYFYDALGNETSTTSNTTYDYSLNNYQPLVTKTTNSKGEEIITKTKYAHEVNDNNLKYLHRISEPVEVEVIRKKGTTVTKLSHQKTKYKFFGPDLYLPEMIQTSKGTQALEDRVVYHSYDTKGNPTEVSKADGTSVVYIWGYNETKPIAKIEGATKTEVTSAINGLPSTYYNSLLKIQNLSNVDNDRTQGTLGKEGALRNALQKLRESSILATAQVTTFTYDPLIGVTSITDPRGETVYYEYDVFNRLKVIKNSDGHIVTEHQYNYKN
ncbi:RHS repeat domain-containing protein [Tenacibaculum jejuense]|uniref:Rhs family protein n=1 Tax=Tenacibaculum jejuense TaxID=584609 RepID=A0A238UAX4_9FLAO|nr:RHS repeat domain-containing protein [Tenacibaculum jejuense]SNR16242.1 Rhs family protein precursor [Tenacibaculum jejuense]